MEGLPFLAGGGVNLTGLQIVDITRIFFLFFPARIQQFANAINITLINNTIHFMMCALKGNFAKKIFFYMFFLMYKYRCLYAY